MNAVTGHAHAQPMPVATLAPRAPLAALAAFWSALARRRLEARAAAILQGLDDRALKDIGVHRTEISSILHHGPRDPSRRPR